MALGALFTIMVGEESWCLCVSLTVASVAGWTDLATLRRVGRESAGWARITRVSRQEFPIVDDLEARSTVNGYFSLISTYVLFFYQALNVV